MYKSRLTAIVYTPQLGPPPPPFSSSSHSPLLPPSLASLPSSYLSSFSSSCNPSSHSFPSPFLPLIFSSSSSACSFSPILLLLPAHPSCSLVSLCSLCYRCFSSRRLYCLVPVFYHGANKLQGRNHQVNAAPPEAISVRSIAAFRRSPLTFYTSLLLLCFISKWLNERMNSCLHTNKPLIFNSRDEQRR